MPVDMFIKLDGIKGEARDAQHPDEVEVLSWNWGMSAQVQAPDRGGGGGAGKVSIQDLAITKFVDAATPGLLLSCASGKRIKTAMLSIRSNRDRPFDAVRIKMEDVGVSSVVVTGAAAESRPTESVNLSFTRVLLEYTGQKPDGTGGVPIAFGWDVKTNSKW